MIRRVRWWKKRGEEERERRKSLKTHTIANAIREARFFGDGRDIFHIALPSPAFFSPLRCWIVNCRSFFAGKTFLSLSPFLFEKLFAQTFVALKIRQSYQHFDTFFSFFFLAISSSSSFHPSHLVFQFLFSCAFNPLTPLILDAMLFFSIRSD